MFGKWVFGMQVQTKLQQQWGEAVMAQEAEESRIIEEMLHHPTYLLPRNYSILRILSVAQGISPRSCSSRPPTGDHSLFHEGVILALPRMMTDKCF